MARLHSSENRFVDMQTDTSVSFSESQYKLRFVLALKPMHKLPSKLLIFESYFFLRMLQTRLITFVLFLTLASNAFCQNSSQLRFDVHFYL